MKPARIADANIVVTDEAVAEAYDESRVDFASSRIFRSAAAPRLNIGCAWEAVSEALRPLEERFGFICGSSNFHHLDVFNLDRLRRKLGEPVQLILVDQHMDCVRFSEEDGFLHCGNWVAFAYRRGLIAKAAMVGCRDYRKLRTFEDSLEKDGNLAYCPDPRDPLPRNFLDPGRPVYLSVDTDVLSVPSDWEPGLHDLDGVLAGAFWDDLARLPFMGAFVHGHVTDGRHLRDLLAEAWRGKFPSARKDRWANLAIGVKHGMLPKLRAGLARPKLTLGEQADIIQTLYARVQEIRH